MKMTFTSSSDVIGGAFNLNEYKSLQLKG